MNKSNKNKLRKNKPPTPKSNKISNSNKFNNKNTKNGFKSKYLNCKDSREHIGKSVNTSSTFICDNLIYQFL